MGRGFKHTGVLTDHELRALPGVPSKERAEQGPVAVVECAEGFPCNPCETACPHGAIVVGNPITNLPRLEENDCVGCGQCIAKCPGLAIFLIDMTYSRDEASVSFPYEYIPLVSVGDQVDAADRSGRVVTRARVIEVDNDSGNDRTAVVTVVVSKEYAWQVRGLRRDRR